MVLTPASSSDNNYTVDNKKNDTKSGNLLFRTLLGENFEFRNTLPEDAVEQMRKEYEESFNDEIFEKLLENADLKNLSDDEKELYKSIIKDRHISDEEVQDLSYEQMKTLNKFRMQKDQYGNYVEESLINTEYKANKLFETALVSKDNTFNKTIFESIKGMDNNDAITSYMATVTGTWNFPWVESYYHDSHNPSEILIELISEMEMKLETSLDTNDMEYYKSVLNLYSNLLEEYDVMSEKELSGDTQRRDYTIDIKQELIDDLLSMLSRGMSVSEIEALEELIGDINRMIDDSKEKDVSENRIKKMIEELKWKISELQQRFGGDVEVKTDDTLETTDSEGLTQDMKRLKSIVLSLEKTLEKLIEESGKNDLTYSTEEEFALKEELKNHKKDK